jgi:ligand-binding sensor domain-containing protein
MSQYVHDRWGGDRGFPGGAVRAIAQTADGYLWIGTERGLIRFDGLEFVLVRGSGANTLIQVVGLAPGPRGGLWVRLPGPNLLLYRDGEFDSAISRVEPPEDAFTSMTPAGEGRILLAGLVSGILRTSGDGFERLSPSVTPRSPVIALAESSEGTVWLGTRDAGLFYLKGGRVTQVARGLPDRKVNCLLTVDGRELWVGTDVGVVRWDGEALVTAGVPPPLRRIQALAMLKDRRSNLWIGTGAGLWRVNALGAARLEPRSGRSPAAVTALLQDREGNLWTGSELGIERLRDSHFATYEGRGPAERTAALRRPANVAPGLFPNREAFLAAGGVGQVVAAGLDSRRLLIAAAGRASGWGAPGGLTHLRVRGAGSRAAASPGRTASRRTASTPSTRVATAACGPLRSAGA